MEPQICQHNNIPQFQKKLCGANGDYCERCPNRPFLKGSEDSAGWQCCPVCLGSGHDPHATVSHTAYPICTVCEGAKIISKLTGNPPINKKGL